MFIAMNCFRVKRGAEGAFEKVWVSCDFISRSRSGFCRVPSAQRGPRRKIILSLPPIQCGRAKPTLRRGPNRRSSALRTRAPATKRPGHSIWSIPNLRASRYDRRSLARRWPHNEVPTASARPLSGGEDGPPQCVSSYGVETAFEAIAAALVRYSSHRTRCSLSTSPHRGVYGGFPPAYTFCGETSGGIRRTDGLWSQ